MKIYKYDSHHFSLKKFAKQTGQINVFRSLEYATLFKNYFEYRQDNFISVSIRMSIQYEDL